MILTQRKVTASRLTAFSQFNHTMFRIRDPGVSIPFYTDVRSTFSTPRCPDDSSSVLRS